MIIILKPHLDVQSKEVQFTLKALSELPNISIDIHSIPGTPNPITEIYLLGETCGLSQDSIEALPGVQKTIRLSTEYKILGKQAGRLPIQFTYNDTVFSQNHFHLFAGLCAVDTLEHVNATFKVLSLNQQTCARMGAYKPRTSPYAFQGLGKSCLPQVFEAAGNYGIKVIAMEVTHERQIQEIHDALSRTGNPTGVMLQIGTRNAQNFELLREVGSQKTFPILFKRGFGITLHESLLAAEYLAHAGNHQIIFCLRGVKSQFGSPHRNLVDVGQVSLIKRLTRMPVCVDPSHAVGSLSAGADRLSDIFHVSAQGVIAGANMVLLDVHPNPPLAKVDNQQAIDLKQLPWYLEDLHIAREAYIKRVQCAYQYHQEKAVDAVC